MIGWSETCVVTFFHIQHKKTRWRGEEVNKDDSSPRRSGFNLADVFVFAPNRREDVGRFPFEFPCCLTYLQKRPARYSIVNHFPRRPGSCRRRRRQGKKFCIFHFVSPRKPKRKSFAWLNRYSEKTVNRIYFQTEREKTGSPNCHFRLVQLPARGRKKEGMSIEALSFSLSLQQSDNGRQKDAGSWCKNLTEFEGKNLFTAALDQWWSVNRFLSRVWAQLVQLQKGPWVRACKLSSQYKVNACSHWNDETDCARSRVEMRLISPDSNSIVSHWPPQCYYYWSRAPHI